MQNNIYIIGAGGVGSWLAPAMCMLVKPERVTVIDGDMLEHKNLNRQLFDEAFLGINKSHALADIYGCHNEPVYYNSGTIQHERSDVVFCCADNNRARNSCLQASDIGGNRVIVAANEKFSSEAYIYRPEWRGTRLDPRVYYPEILTDTANDPAAAAIGCTGVAQEETPQLVTANFSAAALAMNLFVLWVMQVPKLERATLPHLPYRLRQSMSRPEFDLVGEL